MISKSFCIRGVAFSFILAVLLLFTLENSFGQEKSIAIPKILGQTQSDQLLKVDRDFASMATDSGIAQAFAFYAADSATTLQRGVGPVVGRKAIRDLYSDDAGAKLTWQPYFADIASSGDLGYTLGQSQYTVKDSTGAEQTHHGYYVTIWKKQPDHSWKWVLDTGVSAPPPSLEKKKP
jgi:ketosteroid isomerase-like protein